MPQPRLERRRQAELVCIVDFFRTRNVAARIHLRARNEVPALHLHLLESQGSPVFPHILRNVSGESSRQGNIGKILQLRA
jgi:hypothetical protein